MGVPPEPSPRGLRLTLLLVPFFVLCGVGCAHHRASATTDPEAEMARAMAALDAGRFDQAIEAIERALAADDHLALAHRKRVEAYVRRGRTDEVIALYRARLHQRTDDPYGRYALAIALYAKDTANAEEALRLLSEAAAAVPDEPEFVYRRGLIYLDREIWTDAIASLQQAVALAPRRAAYRVPLALALHHAGRHREAMDALQDLFDLDPTPKEVARAREVTESLDSRFTGVPEAVREKMDQAIGWLERADVPQNAIDLLRDILLTYPDLAMAHALLGLAYQRIESSAEALVHLRRAVELAPDAALAHLYLGNFYYGKDRLADAAKSYRAALENDPLLLEAHQMLAEIAQQTGDHERAIRHLRAWSLLVPSATMPRLRLARILTREGDADGAEALLRGVLSTRPGNLEAHLGLGAILVHRFEQATSKTERRRLRKEALEHLDAVAEVQPENTSVATLRKRLER